MYWYAHATSYTLPTEIYWKSTGNLQKQINLISSKFDNQQTQSVVYSLPNVHLNAVCCLSVQCVLPNSMSLF